jgi:hypothetical protein
MDKGDGLSRDEFYHALQALAKAMDSGFDGINKRLDVTNGQVREHGQDIAVLNDRGTRDTGARAGAIASGAVTAAMALWQFFHAK